MGQGPPFGLCFLWADTSWGTRPPATLLSRRTDILPSLLGSSLRPSCAFPSVFCQKSSRLGHPSGSPRPLLVPSLCPVVPAASHRQTVTRLLRLPTTGECCPATAGVQRMPGAGVGLVRGAGACGWRVRLVCGRRSAPPAPFAVTVARAARSGRGSCLARRAGRGLLTVNGLPVLARGAQGRPGGRDSGGAAPRRRRWPRAWCCEAR